MNLKTASYEEILSEIQLLCINTRVSGDEVLGKSCPYCHKEDFKFSVNIQKQVFHCFHENTCGVRGTLFKLFYDTGIISPITRVKSESYKMPKQDNTISATDEYYLWYEKERGVNRETLKKYQVSYKNYNDKKCIIYRYIDESGVERNRKRRNINDKKDISTEKGAEKIYYGSQFLNYDNKKLHIVSGEDDCHILSQIGVENVVSVPFGDKAYTPAMDRINNKFDEIILMFDGDESGQSGAYNFALKAGIHKCKNVVLPYKDARDCVLNGVDIFGIQAEIAKARVFKCDDVVKLSHVKESVISHIYDRKYSAVMLPCQELNMVLGGIRPGELTVFIAHTGSGKTTFALNCIWWSLLAGMRALVLSFEGPIQLQVIKLIEISSGESIRLYDEVYNKWVIAKDREWISNKIDDINKRELYFLNRDSVDSKGYYDIEKLLNIIRYAKKFHDINIVLIDHLHYFLNLTTEKNPTAKIDETMRTISQTTQELNIHTILITHPSKILDDKNGKLIPVGLNSAKGASSIQQEAFNFVTVQRAIIDDKYISRVNILKNRTLGRTGGITFNVLPNMNTYLTDSMIEKDSHWSSEL